MRCSLARSLATLLLIFSFVSSSLFAQSIQDQTRPRRTQPESQPAWVPPPTPSSPIQVPTTTVVQGPQPTIRVALNTDTRSAVISTTSKLMNASNGTSPVALDTQRVRLEAHFLSNAPTVAEALYRVTVTGIETREQAEEIEQQIQKTISEAVHETPDANPATTWGVVVDKPRPRAEAEELIALLDDMGIDGNLTPVDDKAKSAESTPQPNTTSPVRLTAKWALPSREVVASSAASRRLFSSNAPVVFASDNERDAPVRYNDKPYRGHIEVFANLRGSLTVVNELPLEDYVRGVVANELSPGGYPAIEALKAQAVAARTYALKNRGQFMAQGFDILPTTRSQVYRGLTSENQLSNRAVEETAGMIATYEGEPINALYTSTCGGRTESAENIFNHAVPYLRGH